MEWLWSFNVRARAHFRCQLNGIDRIKCNGNLQGAHVVTRGVHGIKFNYRNGRCLCQAHHKYYTHHPEEWSQICAQVWKNDWDWLIQKKWQGVEPSIDNEQRFADMLLDAMDVVYEFPEYLPKVQAIANWATKREEGKT